MGPWLFIDFLIAILVIISCIIGLKRFFVKFGGWVSNLFSMPEDEDNKKEE